MHAQPLPSPTQPHSLTGPQGKTLVLRSRMSNLKPKFGPKVCQAPPCQAFNLTLGQNACFALLQHSCMSNLKPTFGPKVCLAPPCQAFNLIHWGKTLVLRKNFKPRFGPKVCLTPPCQAFNLTLGQNACFALPHVKLETQIRAKGLSSPTMPSLQPYIGAKRLFCAPAALLHVKLETHIRAKGLSSPTMPSLQPYTLGQNACFAQKL